LSENHRISLLFEPQTISGPHGLALINRKKPGRFAPFSPIAHRADGHLPAALRYRIVREPPDQPAF
jgi:hypothetical protein